MSDLLRTTVYLTPENKELLRKAAYLFNKSKTDILNNALKENLEKSIMEFEKQSK
jgi:hypothetical protein